jgi:cytochrome b pre-mRNA-processing protein 3
MMLEALTRLGERKRRAQSLCAALATRARAPVFFRDLAVPDTIDGRFDLLVLHAWLAVERLAGDRRLSQALIDAIFVQFDEGLRDLGTGDMGMGRRIKKIADAFYGRLKAYGGARDDAALADAVLRNVYRGDEACRGQARTLAEYALRARAHLAATGIANGTLDFGPLPA